MLKDYIKYKFCCQLIFYSIRHNFQIKNVELFFFDNVRELYKTVLDKEPNNAYALWGMFLCSFNVLRERRLYDNRQIQIFIIVGGVQVK